MSELRDTIRSAVAEREIGTAEQCRNLRTGEPFTAEIEAIQDTDFNTELGRDPREQVLMYVSDPVAASRIVSNQQVEVSLDGVTQSFYVVRRSLNPAKPQAEFGLTKKLSIDS